MSEGGKCPKFVQRAVRRRRNSYCRRCRRSRVSRFDQCAALFDAVRATSGGDTWRRLPPHACECAVEFQRFERRCDIALDNWPSYR